MHPAQKPYTVPENAEIQFRIPEQQKVRAENVTRIIIKRSKREEVIQFSRYSATEPNAKEEKYMFASNESKNCSDRAENTIPKMKKIEKIA